MNQATIDAARRDAERERRYRESMQRLRDDRPHNAVDCADCGGEGFGSTHDSLHPWREHDVSCLRCNGMGWIEADTDDEADSAFAEDRQREHADEWVDAIRENAA